MFLSPFPYVLNVVVAKLSSFSCTRVVIFTIGRRSESKRKRRQQFPIMTIITRCCYCCRRAAINRTEDESIILENIKYSGTNGRTDGRVHCLSFLLRCEIRNRKLATAMSSTNHKTVKSFNEHELSQLQEATQRNTTQPS